jgi:hypothetical protein
MSYSVRSPQGQLAFAVMTDEPSGFLSATVVNALHANVLSPLPEACLALITE